MPWTSRIDELRGLIYTRVSGALTKPDAIEHREALAAHPAFDPTFCHLLDLREVDHVDLTAAELEALADRSLFHAPSRQVIVAPDELMFDLSRLYHAYRSCQPCHEEIDVCRSVGAACTRLGIENLPPTLLVE